MPSIDTFAEFFGWCSVINIALLIIGTTSLILLRQPVSRIHASMFGVQEAALAPEYFRYLARYKIAIIVFNVVPYIALKIMA